VSSWLRTTLAEVHDAEDPLFRFSQVNIADAHSQIHLPLLVSSLVRHDGVEAGGLDSTRDLLSDHLRQIWIFVLDF